MVVGMTFVGKRAIKRATTRGRAAYLSAVAVALLVSALPRTGTAVGETPAPVGPEHQIEVFFTSKVQRYAYTVSDRLFALHASLYPGGKRHKDPDKARAEVRAHVDATRGRIESTGSELAKRVDEYGFDRLMKQVERAVPYYDPGSDRLPRVRSWLAELDAWLGRGSASVVRTLHLNGNASGLPETGRSQATLVLRRSHDRDKREVTLGSGGPDVVLALTRQRHERFVQVRTPDGVSPPIRLSQKRAKWF